MLLSLAGSWWVALVRGLVAILFGVLAFVWPGMTLLSLVALYAIYCMIDGVAALASASVLHRTGRPWKQMVPAGLVSLGAGVAAFLWPGLSAVILLWIVAAWAIAHGLVEVVAAIRLRKELADEWLLALGGGASILFGIMLFGSPGAGAVALVGFIGAFAVAHGVILVALSFRLRGLREVAGRLAHQLGAA